eukprot:jgi/Astpho2/4526/Aster-x0213
MLEDTLRWRQEARPECVQWDDIQFMAETGRMEILQRHQTDRHNRPVVLLRLRERMVEAKPEEQINFIIWTLEAASRLAAQQPGGDGQVSLLVEMDGYSSSNSPPFSVTRQCIIIAQNYYPDLVGSIVVMTPPFSFWLLFKALSPFLAAETRVKTRFISHGSDCVKETEDIVDSSLIAQSCGGQRPDSCDFAGYCQWAQVLDAERAAAVEAALNGANKGSQSSVRTSQRIID